MSVPPIRIGLIGLSQSAKTSWASEGHLPYLLSIRGRARFKVVALLNSTEEAARRSIEFYGLRPDVKAYGSPQALAADLDVDLVVCTTRVDVHYDAVMPSLEAGKDVFVEWPLAENAKRASELAQTATNSGSRTLVGLQARVAPAVLKVKDVIGSGTIGKVLSSDVQAFTPGGGGYSISEGLAYFLDMKVGGNPVTIAFGHMIDYIHSVLGEYKPSQSHSHTHIQRPNQTIIDKSNRSERPFTSDVPDLVSLHGTLQPSLHVVDGASLTINFRSGPPFPGSASFVWTIAGEKGEIRVTSQRGPFLQSESSAHPIVLELHDFESGEVTEIPWQWEEWQEPLPARSRNIAKLYDIYYEGGTEKYEIADFGAAVRRHEQLDRMLY